MVMIMMTIMIIIVVIVIIILIIIIFIIMIGYEFSIQSKTNMTCLGTLDFNDDILGILLFCPMVIKSMYCFIPMNINIISLLRINMLLTVQTVVVFIDWQKLFSCSKYLHNCNPVRKHCASPHFTLTGQNLKTSSNKKHFPCYWPFVRGIHRLPVTGEFRRTKTSDAKLWYFLWFAPE